MKEKIQSSLIKMSTIIQEMLELVYQGFMENETLYIDRAMNKERIMDDLEEEITTLVVKDAKTYSKKEQKEMALLAQTAQNIERMGDELRSLSERIEVKIVEKLFFSDLGLRQYQEVFELMKGSVTMATQFLQEGKRELLENILKNGDKVKEAVEKYRKEHLERLTQGICEPRAANMYFDMLDFTGNIARHCTNIAKTHKEF